MKTPDKWALNSDYLVREFHLKDFYEVMSLLNKIADLANKQNHHPEFHTTYDTLKVSITTHDAGDTVTDKDIALAQEINDLGNT